MALLKQKHQHIVDDLLHLELGAISVDLVVLGVLGEFYQLLDQMAQKVCVDLEIVKNVLDRRHQVSLLEELLQCFLVEHDAVKRCIEVVADVF